MPALGLAQETGRLLRWHKQEGEAVAVGEPLMEIETDKSAVEIEAAATGFLRGLRVQAGEEVAVGTVMAWILGQGEALPDAGVGAMPSSPAAAPVESEGLGSPPAQPTGTAGPSTEGRAAASPLARRLAAERHVDLIAGGGSGPEGAYQAADLGLGAAPVAVSRARRRMATHTAKVWSTTPHFYLSRDVRARRLRGWLDAVRRRTGEPVTYTDLLIRTVAVALGANPQMSDYWADGEIRHRDGVHVGLAIASPSGLLLATVRDADRLGMVELIATRRRLVQSAQTGRMSGSDLEGASITISNLGMFGVDRFEAVLIDGQSSLLAVGRVRDEVVAVDGRPAVEPVMSVTLSCDHRVLDGAGAAPFLASLVANLEAPSLLPDVVDSA